MTTPIIRQAETPDAAACAAIYAPYVRDTVITFEIDPPDAGEFARRIASYGQSHLWLVAELEGAVAGYAYAGPHAGRCAYATSCDVAIYLDMARCGAGLGTALYAALLPALKQRGFHAAFAGITVPNPASSALHRRFGFTPVGTYREVGWKQERWLDVEWWQRLL